jgi:hypothetical protein
VRCTLKVWNVAEQRKVSAMASCTMALLVNVSRLENPSSSSVQEQAKTSQFVVRSGAVLLARKSLFLCFLGPESRAVHPF